MSHCWSSATAANPHLYCTRCLPSRCPARETSPDFSAQRGTSSVLFASKPSFSCQASSFSLGVGPLSTGGKCLQGVGTKISQGDASNALNSKLHPACAPSYPLLPVPTGPIRKSSQAGFTSQIQLPAHPQEGFPKIFSS